MDFRPVITLGTLLQIVEAIVISVGAYYTLKSAMVTMRGDLNTMGEHIKGRLDVVTETLKAHHLSLDRQGVRLDRHEELIIDLMSGLNRLIGAQDGHWPFRQQHRAPNPDEK